MDAAAAWRLVMDESDLVGEDDGIRAMAGISFGPARRPPGPAVEEELAGYGLIQRTGTVSATAGD